MNGILREFVRTVVRLRRDESGVVLMFTLSVILILYVLCSGVYAVGETIREKIELQAACDSAAYSAALAQADGLSRMAMINRALSWVYVQLSNMEMDYITHKWLKLTLKRFDEDRAACRKWADPVTVCIGCSDCDGYFKSAGKGWFCGSHNGVTFQDNYIKINGASISTNDISDAVAATESMIAAYEQAIPRMKALIETLNGMLAVVNGQMHNAIGGTAQAVLYANLPRRISPTVPGVTEVDVDVARDFIWRIWRTTPPNPYPEDDADEVSGYFSALQNTEKDERMFLAMGDGAAHADLFSFFRAKGQDKNGGLDQWYVRGNPKEIERDEPEIDYDYSAQIMRGICRVYKNANHKGINKKSKVMRGRHTGVIFDTAPSCINTQDFNPEKCRSIGDSVALYADYEWRSTKHLCVCHPKSWGRVRHNSINLPMPSFEGRHIGEHGYGIDGIAYSAKSNSRSAYGADSCYFDQAKFALHSLLLTTPCDEIKSWLLLPPFSYPYGFGRIYGDDREICNETTYQYYAGEVAKPWVLNERFYGQDGSIVVGLARKQRNPWAVLLRRAANAVGMDGVMSAFNPTSYREKTYASGNPGAAPMTENYITAFSAARAAHRYHPSPEAAELIGGEHPGWDDVRYYETRHDAVCKHVVVHESPEFSDTGVGCVCDAASGATKDNSKRYARCWNLCETDWDATLLPLRFAASSAGDYDSFVRKQVKYSSAVKDDDTFRSALVSTNAYNAALGWLPFYDSDGRLLMDMSVDLSDYVLQSPESRFLAMPQPLLVLTAQSQPGAQTDRRGFLWSFDVKSRSSEQRQPGRWLDESKENIRQRIL